MRYPGVTFMFDDETPTSSSLGSGSGSIRRAIGAGPTDENKRAEVRKIVIMQRGVNGEAVDAFDEVLEHPIMSGDLKKVVVKINEGIDMYFYPSSSSPSPRRLLLGQSSAEDIRFELGEPMSIHYKDDDRITIHGASDRENDSPLNSYFMNYFHHGMDLLIDGQSHILKKIVLHSNTVGSPLFQQYKRCPWEIADPSVNSSERVVSYAESLEDHKSFLGQMSEASQPMELDRSEEYEALSIPAYFTPTSGPSAALSLLKPPGTSLTSTSPTTSGSLLATGNIVVISVDPKSTLRPLFIDDADGTLEKSAGEMQIKAKKYLAFVRNVEHTTTTVTTTTMMAVPMEEEGVEDQDVTIRRPSVASTIKGIEKKITTTTTRVHLNLLHTAIPTRSRYDTVDETMNVPLALYHSRSAARSRLTDNSTVISDRDPLRVRNGHGLFRKYKHLYAHTIMDAYAVVSEVTHSPEIETSNTKLYTTRRNRVPSISRRDLKRYDMYQKIDRIKESNQFVTSNSPTTPTTPSTPASLSSPRYQSTTRRLGKTSTQSIALLSSQGGVQEEGESDFGEDEGEAEEAPHLGDNEDEDLHEDEDEDDEDDGSQFRLSTVISSLSVDNEGSSAPWADPSHRLSPNGRSVSSSSSPSVSRASSLRKRRGGGSAAPSAWKTTKSGSGRRSSRSPQPHQQPSSLSTNDDSPRSTSPRDSASPSPPSLSSPPTKSTISLKIPSPPSLPRSPTPVVSPPRTASETDTTSSARGRTSSEWPSSTPQSDSHGTQATSLHSSQNTDENVKLGDSNSYPSSLATGDSSFGDSSSSEDERGRKGKEEDDEQEDAEDEDKVWKEKCDLGGGLSAHKPLNRQCLIYVKASFLPSTMNNRRQTVESSDEEEDVPPEDPRMFFEELKMLRA
ncbi:hypothetical protein FRC17_004728, partial [Serendipita sp. 399]